MNSSKKRLWWQEAVFYHIYPMSFKDSNSDGVGDVPGIISKLEYLQWLGINAIWLSPIYCTPFKDYGYDISDYKNIDPLFGTMKDFEELIEKSHSKGIKLIMDFVSNHTSDQHLWFKESKSDRNHPKRDWYIWADPNPKGGPPNNWLSTFGGSGWEFDSHTGQYYYHSFLKEQPDLNWRNPEVQNALWDVMRFWLEKGVDGFRVDVMWYLLKDKLLRNNPPNPNYKKEMISYNQFNPCFSTDQPEIHEIIAHMRSLVDSYGEKVLIGEVYLPADQLVQYYGMEKPGAHLPGNFLFIVEEWNAKKIYNGICNYEASLPKEAWPNWVLSNHDNPRIVSRVGKSQARVAALLMLTLKGTPIIYYGEEIGMSDAAIPKDKIKDKTEQSRDPERTPMQWSAEANAGFTQGNPWLTVCEDFKTVNVELEEKDPDSFLRFYKELIDFRRKESTLIDGTFIPVGIQGDIFAFMRKDESKEKTFLIVCNLGHDREIFEIPEYFDLSGHVIFGTDIEKKGKEIGNQIKLSGSEAFIALVASNI